MLALGALAVTAAPAAAEDYLVTTLASDDSPGSLRAAWEAADDGFPDHTPDG